MAEVTSIAEKRGRAKPPPTPIEAPSDLTDPFKGTAVELSIDRIEEQRNPRILASESEQKALNDSVRMHGVLQPIRVRPLDETGTRFAIVAGHRRLTAAKSARLHTIPAVVTVVDETAAFVQSLVENLQREDLNPLDEAKAIQQLLDETGDTQEALGKRLGKKQSTISNSLRLLTLEEVVKTAIETGSLSASHGKALAALPPEQQTQVAAEAVATKMASREVEDRIRKAKEDAKRQEGARTQREAQATKATELFKAFLTKGHRKAKDVTVIVTGYGNQHIVEAFEGLGAQARTERSGDRDKPDYACSEQVTTFTYNDWKGTFESTCTEPKHHADYVKERDKEKVAKQKEVTKKLDRTKTAVMKGIRSDDGKGALNIDGQRLVLYQLLLSNRGYAYGGRGGERYEAFVKRHGGPAGEAKSIIAADVIEAIEGLDEKDLGQELALAAVNGMFINLWGENAHANAVGDDWGVRQVLVTKFGLDEDLVFGEAPVPMAVLEGKKARGQALADAEQAQVDRVAAERAESEARWKATQDDTADDDESEDTGDAE